MEQYIPIGRIKAFVYSPRSVYIQSVYDTFNQKMSDLPLRLRGERKHHSIDSSTYSTSKHIISGLDVYSEKYNIGGKIDVYDRKNKYLIERKTKAHTEGTLYDGYVYQLYAQYFCLKEMGEDPQRLFIHSLEDNKRYEIPIPSELEKEKFENLLIEMREFIPSNKKESNISSVYEPLNW